MYINAYKTSSTNKKQPSDVNFACLCCWTEESLRKKLLKHFEYYHNQGWIPAGAALVLFSFLLDSEKGWNNIAIRYNCCYVWPTGMNHIMEEDYWALLLQRWCILPGPKSQSFIVSKVKEIKIVIIIIWILASLQQHIPTRSLGICEWAAVCVCGWGHIIQILVISQLRITRVCQLTEELIH